MTVEDTLKNRGSVYGDRNTQAIAEMHLKDYFRQQQSWNRMSANMQSTMDLIATKLSRILVGDPAYLDNWHDIAGYATLVEKELVPSDPTDKEEWDKNRPDSGVVSNTKYKTGDVVEYIGKDGVECRIKLGAPGW